MANSKITLTFNQALADGDTVYFELWSTTTNSLVRVMQEEFVSGFRAERYTIEAGYMGYPDSYNYLIYWDLDYNGINQFTLTRVDNVITIEANNSWFFFDNFSSTGGKVSAVITGAATFSNFEVLTNTVTASTPVCDNVNYKLTTNINIDKYILDDVEVDHNGTTLDISYPRGEQFSVIVIDDDGNKIYFPTETTVSLSDTVLVTSYLIYDRLLTENIIANVSISLNGGTVQINVLNKEGLELQYSLDGVTYQTSNIFTGQPVGDYTCWVKDQFNCIKTRDFSIIEIGTRPAYMEISKANAVNFVKVENIDNVSIFKNDINSFNYNGLEKFKYCSDTLFNKTDLPRLQIKSNYPTMTARMRYEDGSESGLTLIQKSNNLSRHEKIDCVYYRHSSGKLGVYFNSGNVYDQFGIVTGTYDLNGNLPLFAKIGNYVDVDGFGLLQVYSVLLDYDLNKKVILFDQEYGGVTTISTAESIYDLLNYDIYEIELNVNGYDSGLYDIVIEGTYTDASEVCWVSENIDIQDDHVDTLPIVYYNNDKNNRDIFYKYGIKNFMRVDFSDLEGYFKEDNSLNVNDDNVRSITSMLNEGDEFLFENLDKKKMQTLSIALSCENVFISGIGYIKDGDLDISKIENTNVYSIKAKMLKSGESYTTDESGYSGTDELNETLYVPSILTDGINFIKI